MTPSDIREKAEELLTPCEHEPCLSGDTKHLVRTKDFTVRLDRMLSQAHARGREEYIKDLLMRFHKARLDGGNLDFFFVLNTDLAALRPEEGEKLKCKDCGGTGVLPATLCCHAFEGCGCGKSARLCPACQPRPDGDEGGD